MKACLLGLLCALLLGPRRAAAQAGDGGTAACTTNADCGGTPGAPYCAKDGTCQACIDYAGNPCVPVACDGSLCDTTNGAGCSTQSNAEGPSPWLIVLGALALSRRRGRERAP